MEIFRKLLQVFIGGKNAKKSLQKVIDLHPFPSKEFCDFHCTYW